MAKKKATPSKKAAGKAKAPARKPARPAGKPAPKKKAAPAKKAKQAPARPAATAGKKKPAPTPKKAAPKAAAKKAAPKRPAPAAKPAPPAKKTAPAKAAVKKAAPPASSKPAVAAKAAAPAKPPAPAPKAAPAKAPEAAKPAAPVKAARAPKPKEPIMAVMTGLEPLGGPARTLKRALKERFQQEFYLRATPGSLYDLISSPSGFSEWFCDDVDVSGDEFTFKWGPETQHAECLSRKFGEMIRFRWLDDDDPGAFFELRIRIDPMTNETCLVVTDHAWPQDLEEAKALWESQIQTLARVLGA